VSSKRETRRSALVSHLPGHEAPAARTNAVRVSLPQIQQCQRPAAPAEPVSLQTIRRSGPRPRSTACPTRRTVILARPSGRPPQRWRAFRARRSPCQPRCSARGSGEDLRVGIEQKQQTARQTRRPIADPVRRCFSARATSAAGADGQLYRQVNRGRQPVCCGAIVGLCESGKPARSAQ